MKKTLLFILFGLFINTVYAQNIQLLEPVTYKQGNASEILYIKMHVKNNSASSMDVFTKRSIVSLIPGHLSYFCFGITCYPPSVNTSPDNITLAPGQEDTSIKTYIDPRGEIGSSTVNYCIYNVAKTDSACLTMVYDIATATGIINNSHKKFVKVFPNPATTELKLVYNAEKQYSNTELQIIDLQGRIVYSENVSNVQGLINVNVSGMNSGIYFCKLIADGYSIAQDKVVIQ